MFVTDKSNRANMRTKYSGHANTKTTFSPQSVSVLPIPGEVLARLLVVYGIRVEMLVDAVESSTYRVSTMTVSTAILSEHLTGL